MQQNNKQTQQFKQPQQSPLKNQKKSKNTDIQQHHDSCTCILCQKQHEIQQMRKQRTKMHFQSIYKNDFLGKKSKIKNSCDQQKLQNRRERKQKSLVQMPTYNMGYLELQSTYNNDFVSKKIEISKMRPMDQLGTGENYLPSSTTYMKSYHSTLTPKPDDPFKRTEQPVGLAIPFSSQSVYQKAYKRQHSPRPNLPFIHRQNISKPKSIGTFESTQKQSYSTMILNPEIKNADHFTIKKPSGNLVNLSSFAHNYDTTYRNFFVGITNKSHYKHDIDQIGNINRRTNNFKQQILHQKRIKNILIVGSCPLCQFYCPKSPYNIHINQQNMIQKSNYNRWRPMHKNDKRLQFPQNGDSGFYDRVGRKHYPLLYHKSDEYQQSPEFLEMQNQSRMYQKEKMQRKKGNSVQLLRAPPLLDRKQQKKVKFQEGDSLVMYEKQYDNMRLERNNSVRQPMSSSQNKIMPRPYIQKLSYNNNNNYRQFSPNYNQYEQKSVPNVNGTKNNREFNSIDMINSDINKKIQDNKNYIRNLIKNSYTVGRDNPKRSQALPNINKHDQSQMKIFSTVENLYDIVHKDDNKVRNNGQKQRKVPPYQYASTRVISPTYISSIFQG